MFRFVSDVVSKLVGYATVLVGDESISNINLQSPGERLQVSMEEEEDWPQTSDTLCSFAQRTMLLLISILDWCHGYSMPIQRPHHASAKGLHVEMAAAGMLRVGLPSAGSTVPEVDVALDRDKGKILLAVHSLMVRIDSSSRCYGFCPILFHVLIQIQTACNFVMTEMHALSCVTLLDACSTLGTSGNSWNVLAGVSLEHCIS